MSEQDTQETKHDLDAARDAGRFRLTATTPPTPGVTQYGGATVDIAPKSFRQRVNDLCDLTFEVAERGSAADLSHFDALRTMVDGLVRDFDTTPASGGTPRGVVRDADEGAAAPKALDRYCGNAACGFNYATGEAACMKCGQPTTQLHTGTPAPTGGAPTRSDAGDADALLTQYEGIVAWQANPLAHPLTCGNDSQRHRPLYPILHERRVELRCHDCDYRQTWAPSFTPASGGAAPTGERAGGAQSSDTARLDALERWALDYCGEGDSRRIVEVERFADGDTPPHEFNVIGPRLTDYSWQTGVGHSLRAAIDAARAARPAREGATDA